MRKELQRLTSINESIAGADASVEVPKLKLLAIIAIAFIHYYHGEHFAQILLHAGKIQNHRETQRLGNDRP